MVNALKRRLRGAAARIHEDYLMGSRLGDYRRFLETLQAKSVRILGVEAFQEAHRLGRLESGVPIAILRHDVDTGPDTARRMWEIEMALGIRSTYYFRLCTLAPDLMKEMHASGCEVSYHFEEVATYAKEAGVSSPGALRERFGLIGERFLANLDRVRGLSGAPCRTVASHGDFANRATGVLNWEFLRDESLRGKAGVTLETYDEAYTSLITHFISDKCGRPWWKTIDPGWHDWSGDTIAQILVHPRHWRTEWIENTRENWARLRGGMALRKGRRTA